MHQIDDSGPVLPDRLEAGLQAAFGRAEGEASVLEVVSRIAGCDAKVLLREIEQGETPAPLVEASGRKGDAPAPGRGSYHVLGRLGGGGMGEVLKAHDLDLGRDVALKVLRDEHRSDPALLRRFVEEAQVGGQLQHPGIVPVYELGLMADQRPYFAMRLVKGRTLSALLKTRRDPGEDRRRFLGIFEDVCLTVAYAHSRGVIHRDLKPSNVMVGAFGEVQVVDWGLAKILRKGKRGDSHGQTDEEVSRIETVRSRSGSTETDSVDGAVIGTPVCMPPEQARGEVERLDERSDVFALGAILAQILTGRPLYRGSGEEILAQALRAELGPIREALAACDAEPELVELCEDCLSATPAERPADAGVVARRLHDHLEAIEARSRTAQIEAAEARVRAAAERRARKLTVSLAASVVVTVLALGGGWGWLEVKAAERERERTARVDAALAEASLTRGRAQWPDAVSAARRAVALAESEGGSYELAARADFALAAIESEADDALRAARLEEDNRALLTALEELRQPEGDAIYPTDWAELDAAYGRFFAAHGVDVEGEAFEGALAAIRSRGIDVQLAAALDEWALVRRKAEDDGGAMRLWSLADEVDTDLDRIALRDALRTDDVDVLQARAEDPSGLPEGTVLLLGRALHGVGAHDEAVAVYRHGLRRWPGSYTLNVHMARLLARTEPTQAVGYYRAALALREDSAEVRHEMGILLEKELGELDRASELFHDSAQLRPDDVHLQLHLAWHHLQRGHGADAMTHVRRTVESHPTSGMAHLTLGRMLHARGELDEAIVEYREAVRLAPELAEAHFQLASAIWYGRSFDTAVLSEAIEHLELAVARAPNHVGALNTLACAYSQAGRFDDAMDLFQHVLVLDEADPVALAGLGDVHRALGEWEEALECYRRADAMHSVPVGRAAFYANFGWSLREAGLLEKAVEAYQQALDLEPGSPIALGGLGIVLLEQGETEEGVRLLREAVELDPTTAVPFTSWLGIGLNHLGRYDDACAAYEQHLDVHPCANAAFSLAILLRRLGKFEEAESWCRRAMSFDVGWETSRMLPEMFHTLLAVLLSERGLHEESMDSHLRSRELVEARAVEATGIDAAREEKVRTESAYCLSALSWFLSTTRDPFYRNAEEAQIRARAAVELDPKAGWAWGALGAAQYRLGRMDEAVGTLTRAIELAAHSEFPLEADFYLAMALHGSDRPEDARRRYERAAELLQRRGYPYRDLHALQEEAALLLGLGDEEGAGSDEAPRD